jgi:predicted esterase
MISVLDGRLRAKGLAPTLALILVLVAGAISSAADTVTLKNGMRLEGTFGPIATIAGDPLAATGPTALKRIVVCDDKLRRIFIGTNQLASEFAKPEVARTERFLVKQRVNLQGRGVGSVGTILRVTPWDEFGRRIFTMSTSEGPVNIVQGITEITPTYTKVSALQGSGNYFWEMSIATSSIPADALSKILQRCINPKNSDERLKIVLLYIQSERIQDARTELGGVIKDFPGLAALPPVQKELTQMAAQRLIKEVELRRDAGQPLLAIAMLDKFPSEGVAGDTLLRVREMLASFKDLELQGQQVGQALDQQLALIKDERLQKDLAPAIAEIKSELNIYNLPRMADFIRLSTDPTMEPDDKLSLAIGGWLLGPNNGVETLGISRSMFEVRTLVLQYLRTKRKPERDAILEKLASFEGATPQNLARLIAHMRPPLEPAPAEDAAVNPGDVKEILGPAKGEAAEPEQSAKPEGEEAPRMIVGATTTPGLYKMMVAGLPEDPELVYWVQTPPEYSPYRRYPCIVTLNGGGTSPVQQIDWWAGDFKPEAKSRFGQASRHGYVVIAPQWLHEHQRDYQFSAREHAAVLRPLRDACKQFSIDTDRVFLSGHSLGGDAAWDIGLAHPDLWAGVLPIVASADKHVGRYWENAKYVPLYFVSGELDGDKLAKNAVDWDRYLKMTGCDATIVQYQGRGHEHFHDEIQNLFQWMNLHQRNFFPKEFNVTTMRPWDSFFWWVDVEGLPDNLMILPAEWPKNGMRAGEFQGKVITSRPASGTPLHRVDVDVKARKVTVWLSPELVNFDEKVVVNINSKDIKNISPNTGVLLEDVRSRGDRQHPFWAKVESP